MVLHLRWDEKEGKPSRDAHLNCTQPRYLEWLGSIREQGVDLEFDLSLNTQAHFPGLLHHLSLFLVAHVEDHFLQFRSLIGT